MPLIMDEGLPDVSTISMTQNQQMPIQLRIKNRRKRYLEQHPEYFDSSLELADPLLYDRLIRRFQTPAEREIERRQKGYAGTLEADLLRSEAKLDEAQHHSEGTTFTKTEEGEFIAEAEDNEPSLDRDEARERWVDAMTVRFVSGKDDDFDYKAIDESEEYDDRQTEERERQEEWFDEEEPESSPGQDDAKGTLEGETGIQDY